MLSVLLACSGCMPTRKPDAYASAPADTAFKALADQFVAGYLAWRPATATSLGIHTYDGRVTDFTAESLKAELARLKSFDKQFAQIDLRQLSATAAYDCRILRSQIKGEIFSFEELREFSANPMTYSTALDVNTYIKRNFAPLDQRARSIVSVLETVPEIFAAARANLAGSLPRPHLETAIEEANGAIDFLKKDLVTALEPVKDASIRTDFEQANDRAVTEVQAYVSYLKEEKLPRASDNFALGRDRYSRMLENGEMITMPPEQLLDIGMRELKRKQQVFAETARVIDPSNTARDVFQAIQKDHPTEQSLIPDVRRDLEKIRQFVIQRQLVAIPSPTRARVTETPQFLRAASFASMDTPGPFEKKGTEAYYYVTPVEADWPPVQKEEWLTAFNYYTTDIVSIHEAYPGHYVQFLCLNASPATRIEKIFSSYAFVEGWAHYAEQMMVDEGFGGEGEPVAAAKYRLAQTDEALLRICRLCVSIRMHCQGMTVDEATKFFQDNCYYEEKPARQEAVRGAFDPEFLKLRDDFQKQEGAKFSLEKFHNELLRHGAPPVRLLREIMLKDRASWDAVL
jgi:uncharacterized protein (DUF885 family)